MTIIKRKAYTHSSLARFVAATLALTAGPAARADESGGMDFSYSGSIRTEAAFSTSGSENPFNQRGNPFNDVPVQRHSGVLPDDVVIRSGDPASNDLNVLLLRGELRGHFKLSEHSNIAVRGKALYDPRLYQEYDPDSVDSQASGALSGAPNYFKYQVEGRSHPNPLEWSGRDYQVYIPDLYYMYNDGPLTVIAGNQQIAWGQAIFFRVLDVPNGLDLRRHSALDIASEEFQDKRVPALAIRANVQINPNWLVDGYVQRFQPTVLSNPNTQYNAIASQFTIHDHYGDYDRKLDFGLRLKADFGGFGAQAIAVRRYNPDGVFRWTESGVNRDLGLAPGTGALLAQTPFEADPSGVWSAKEWFTYAALQRLSGVEALNAVVTEFEAAGLLGATTVSNYDQAAQELDLFFTLSGSGLRGHIAREYVRETDFGLGGSYVFSGAPDSLTDQLILNVEALYVPKRTFTDISLTRDYLREDELTTAVVLEKYQRFSSEFPATYLVTQWLHKTRSDLFGRSLEGMDGDVNNVSRGSNGGYDAIAVAVQQPFPHLIWQFDLALLYEPAGGMLVQPAVHWKPSGNVTVDAFYNFLQGQLAGNPNSNALSTFDYADEVCLRIGYQF